MCLVAGVSRTFFLDRLERVRVDAHDVLDGDGCFTMIAARLGVAPLVIADAFQFRSTCMLPDAWWEI